MLSATVFPRCPRRSWSASPAISFYLVRRVSRGNVENSIIHGLFDFSLLSGSAVLADQAAYIGTLLPVLVYPVLAIILLVERHDIEPATTV